jgi:succinate-semialdehyde dehydrogenase/glutarate-semialdehyde dehydrogenase
MTIAHHIPQVDHHLPDLTATARGLYIDGAWQPSRSGRTIDVVNPSTGEVLATVPDATIEDARASVEAASDGGLRRHASAPRSCAGASSL